MTLTIQGKKYYNLQDLVTNTQTTVSVYMDALKKCHIDLYPVEDSYYIYEKDIPTLFAELASSRPVKKYHIPSFFQGQPEAWLHELNTVYESPDACPACLSPEQGQLIRALILNIAPRHIVEIGTFIGVSTIWMAGALEEIGGESAISSIDLFQDILPFQSSNFIYIDKPLKRLKDRLDRIGLRHRVNFFKGNSVQIGSNYARLINKPIDFLYIDGDHTVPGCLTDFNLYEPHVVDGGFILLHDIYPFSGWDGPRYVLDNVIPQRPDLSVVELPTRPNFGIAIIRKQARPAGGN